MQLLPSLKRAIDDRALNRCRTPGITTLGMSGGVIARALDAISPWEGFVTPPWSLCDASDTIRDMVRQ